MLALCAHSISHSSKLAVTLPFHLTSTIAKSAEQAAKAVTAETQSTKRAAVTAPVPFSSEDDVPQEYSAPAPAQVISVPVTAAAEPAEQFSNSNDDRRFLQAELGLGTGVSGLTGGQLGPGTTDAGMMMGSGTTFPGAPAPPSVLSGM
jgi:hypothetical protein